MTNEEAKEVFLNRGFVNGVFDGDKWRQSIFVISEWLQSNSDEDCISRKAVLNLTKELRFDIVKGMEDYCYRCIDPYDVEELPSIQPKPIEGDAISRKAVLNTLDSMDKALTENRTVEEYKELLRECFKVLTPIQPKGADE